MSQQQQHPYIDSDFSTQLPEEVVLNIFHKLSPSDLCRTSSVSREWNRYATDEQIWKDHCLSYYNKETNREMSSPYSPPEINFRSLFKRRKLIDSRWKCGKSSLSVLSGHQDVVFCTKIIDERHVISSGSDTAVRLWNLKDRTQDTLLYTHQGGTLSMDYNPATQQLATGSFEGTVMVHDVCMDRNTKLSSLRIKEIKEILDKAGVSYADCTEKSELLARARTSNAVPYVFKTHTISTGQGVLVGIHVNDGLLASAGHSTTIKIWSLENSECTQTLRGHVDSVNAVNFIDHNTKLVTASNDTSVRLWDVPTGKQIKAMTGHSGWVWGMQVDELSGIAVTSSVDCSIRIFDVKSSSASSIATLVGHQQPVSSVKVLWDKNYIISASFDATVRVWDMRMRRFLYSLRGPRDRCTRCDADDTKIVAASFDGDVRVWSFDV